MPNIAAVLKEEIIRLARKEVRTQTKSIAKASAQYRRDIAELKRQNSKAKAVIARLQRQVPKAVPGAVAEAETAKLRFTSKGIASQRKRLGISAAAYGKLIGITGHTVYKWEHGTSRPRKAQVTKLAGLRGLGKREAMARLEQLGKKASKGRKKRG